MFKFPRDIQAFLEKNPAYQDYVNANQGDYRYLRCEFPELMGYNTLRRPEWLPRSLKFPYFEKSFGFQKSLDGKGKDDIHYALKKADIHLDEKAIAIMPWGEIRAGRWKKNSNIQVTVKIFDKSKPEWELEDQLLQLEICKTHSVGHVNFVHYYGSLENKIMKYHIFEHMARGSLLDVLRNESHADMKLLNDDILRKMWCQIVFAISHLHDKDMVHRNLKMENIQVSKHWDIRITDLAFLEKTTAQNRGDPQIISRTKYRIEYGPKMYRSPERMKQIGFNPLLDQVWGLGVILYAMFHRKFPFSFQEGNKEHIDHLVSRGTIYPRSSYPNGLINLFHSIFQPEELRPRTWELFDFPWFVAEPTSAAMKKANAIGRFTHEKAKSIMNEKARRLEIRKEVFKRFRLFRSDLLRQPNFQRQEVEKAEAMLERAESLIGHKPFSKKELKYNFATLHDYEKLHKNEYWPSLFEFNPIKCDHLGIKRNYCEIETDPQDMMGNLLKLQDKTVKQYAVPPGKNDPPKRPPLNLEFIDIYDDNAQ